MKIYGAELLSQVCQGRVERAGGIFFGEEARGEHLGDFAQQIGKAKGGRSLSHLLKLSNILYTIRRYYELITSTIKRGKGGYEGRGWDVGKKWVSLCFSIEKWS